MSATALRQSFRRRFRAVARQIWSLHVGRGVALTGLVAAGAAVVAALAARWVVRPALAWNRARVAAELEGLFPRLGQRLRTASQHGPRPAEELLRDGVSPSLVAALE